MIVYGSSGLTAAMRSASSPASRPRPRSRSESTEIVSWTGSIEMIASSCGSWSRTATIFATCASSSQTTKRDSELPTTHAHSSGEFVG